MTDDAVLKSRDIRILPSNVANMIAAGEVVQRPSSVVKELMENAVDAGATKVSVIVVDAGRTLIQVIDNGCGMSPDQAVLCFERHATSKIATAEDLLDISTFGFRGEALASIAAVSEVTLKTRRPEDEVGCKVEFADSRHVSTDEITTPAGANFAVRNLFYNVPARRKFLKSDNVEMKHIADEFIRVALTCPDIAFSLVHNDRELYGLKPAKSLKFRIQDIFGASVSGQLVEVGAETSVVSVGGFTGRPDQARKTLGNQFFFVNGRFFRSPYLHKAVMKAYENLVPQGVTPSYFIYLQMNPSDVDVNISPTKTEVKFDDEGVVFQTLFACVREAAGRNSFGASLDFETQDVPEMPVFSRDFDKFMPDVIQPQVNVDPFYNPFDSGARSSGISAGKDQGKRTGTSAYVDKREDYGRLFEDKIVSRPSILLINRKYVAVQIKSGLLFIDVARAWERIMYERFLKALNGGEHVTQTALFPVQVAVGVDNRLIFEEHAEFLKTLGFDISPFGMDTIVVNGMPEGFQVDQVSVEAAMADVLVTLSEGRQSLKDMMETTMAEKFAKTGASGAKPVENAAEAEVLIASLKSCSNPEFTSSGKRIMAVMTTEDIAGLL